MIDVVGVKFENNNKIYYFSPNDFELYIGDFVLVDTERGIQFGKVCEEIKKIKENNLFFPLKNVIKKCTKKDIDINEKNKKDSNSALNYAKKSANELDLKMKFYDANFTFDRKQLILKFVADDRVDFRELTKLLAAKYKTRIELRQIGVRDKAKDVSGLGPCGRLLCCSEFLTNFESVSINMAKNQGIALNPNKINGVCGRLLCCLSYEDEVYDYNKNKLPKIGETIKYGSIKGKVVELDVLNLKYKVLTDDNQEIIIDGE